jgi:hypothetical protein
MTGDCVVAWGAEPDADEEPAAADEEPATPAEPDEEPADPEPDEEPATSAEPAPDEAPAVPEPAAAVPDPLAAGGAVPDPLAAGVPVAATDGWAAGCSWAPTTPMTTAATTDPAPSTWVARRTRVSAARRLVGSLCATAMGAASGGDLYGR